ncbi:MAG: cysteine desulfurase [Crocinitomicaceae bacterium TMED45]|nr:MAG: cysteine desulfurase [Crocinitomicaceae bacterium TMED45]
MKDIKQQFPILNSKLPSGNTLVYLDSANSSQKPQRVINRMTQFYSQEYSSIGRSIHELSNNATMLVEKSREAMQDFINASEPDEIVFTKSATESINMVATAYGRIMEEGDEIITTEIEHHSNYIPWHLQRKHNGFKIKFITVNEQHRLNLHELESLITPKTKIIAITHLSNTTGEIVDIKKICEIAHKHDIAVCVDGTQGAPHLKVDVRDMDCDFYVMSGHKMYGPSGIGILYAKRDWIEKLDPALGGGGMISKVEHDNVEFIDGSKKWEAGTLAVAEIVGLHEALKFYINTGVDNMIAHEKEIIDYAYSELSKLDKIKIIGTQDRSAVISFNIEGIHHQDLAMFLDSYGIAIRPGHHCTQMLHRQIGWSGSCRISTGVYNDKQDIDYLVSCLKEIQKKFS